MKWWSQEEIDKRAKAQAIYDALFPNPPKTAQEVADSFNIRGTIKSLL